MTLPALNTQDAAMVKVCDLARELSHLLNTMPTRMRIIIEPSDTATQPVVVEEIDGLVRMHELDLMSQGLKMIERGAMARDPRIAGLGLIWGEDGERHEHFGGVAVLYRKGQP